MFNNKNFSSFLKLCSVLPALAIMPAVAEASNPVDVALGDDSVAYTGPTIALTENVVQAKGHSVKGGSDLTIDFAGHTYSAYGEPAGSTGTKNQMFQFLKGSDITLKNGKLNIADDAQDGFRFLIQNYSELNLDNMVLDATNADTAKIPYALSNNNGVTKIKNSTIVSHPDGYAFDLYYYGNTTYGDVSVYVENSNIIGNIEIAGASGVTDTVNHAKLYLDGGNIITGNIANDGTVNVKGNLVLDGVIAGTGNVNFADGSSLETVLEGTIITGDKVTGTTTLVLDKESDGKSFKINGTTENSLKFTDNVLFDVTSAGDELKTWTISRKSVAEQTAGLEKAGLDSSAAKTIAAISGVKTTGNAAADALFADLTVAAQSGDTAAAETINEVAKVINPESEAVVQSAAVSTQNTITTLTAGRMDMGRNGGDLSLTSGGVWVQGLFNRAKSGDKFSANTRGISAGIDGTINNDIMLGIGYAYGHSDVSAKTRDTDIDNHSVFLYGQYKPTQWYANATVNYTTSGYKENGSIAGLLAVNSDYRANAFGANVATGYELPFGLTPELGLRYLHVRTNDYTNSLGFHTDAKNTNFLTGIIGARYGFDIAASEALLVRPELSAAAKYDLVSDGNTATVALPGVDAYTLDVERLKRFGGEFGAGLTMSYYGFDLSLTYSIDVREDYTSQTGMAKFRYNF